MKTYNTEVDNIFIIFTDQSVRHLEIEDKVNLALINRNDTFFYKPKKKKKMPNDLDFCHLLEIILTNTGNNYWIPLQKQN